jgi:hypothetical protein
MYALGNVVLKSLICSGKPTNTFNTLQSIECKILLLIKPDFFCQPDLK